MKSKNNPVLTNRNLGGHQSKIQGIGHGDLVIDGEGNAFIFCLNIIFTVYSPVVGNLSKLFCIPLKCILEFDEFPSFFDRV